MKLYLASKFAMKDKVDALSKFLQLKGHQITCIWWKDDVKRIGSTDEEWYQLPIIKYICSRDFQGVDNADALILISNENESMSFNGANVEIGYATAKDKKVFILGKVDRNTLYSNCIFCKTIEDLITKLASQSAKPGQPSHSCTPCLADTHDSKHSGANDSEILNSICPIATTCENIYSCEHAKPHKRTNGCAVHCIVIPDMWLDKGLPRSKQEKADAVRDVKE